MTKPLKDDHTLADTEHMTEEAEPGELVEGIDYYMDGPAFVFTAAYHSRRGYCCNSGCRHCPYGEPEPAGS